MRIDPDAPAESLSAAHRQLLQVARALAFDCRVLVLDEPTTALTDAEADHLFDVSRAARRGGTTILYVSHRLPEVFRLCDRITVLRDGAFVGTLHAIGGRRPNDIVQRHGRAAICRHGHDELERSSTKRVSANAQTRSSVASLSTSRERSHFRDVIASNVRAR